MKTLIKILKEENESSELAGDILNDSVVALMSGRPSEEIKSLKGRADSNPGELLKSVGDNSLPDSSSKISNLEEIFRGMISGDNVSKDHPAQKFKNFFDTPKMVIAPNKTAPGILIRLTADSKKAIGKSGSPKKTLRIFAFWFASIVTAINNSNPSYFGIESNKFKFQFASGQQALLIYVSSGKSWKNL